MNQNEKRKQNGGPWLGKGLMILIIGLVVLGTIYVRIYYHAGQEAVAYLENPQGYSVEYLQRDEIVFLPTQESDTGFIFYPGGKVQYEAYAPLMGELAKRGITCVLVRMPVNLAVLAPDTADGIQDRLPEVENWYIGGHSLGGAMAASYVGKHTEDYQGFILLAAYTTKDLSQTNLQALLIYGSEDQVMKRDKYEENKKKLPVQYEEVILSGGCHGYFGDYGEQKGDGIATITPEEQWFTTAEYISEWMIRNQI